MSNSDLDQSILTLAQTTFFKTMRNLAGTNVKVESSESQTQNTLKPVGDIIGIVEFSGCVNGLVAFSSDEKTIAKCFDLDDLSDEEDLEDIESAMKEMSNVMGAKSLVVLKQKYPVLSISAPLIIYGKISTPKVRQLSEVVTTNLGQFSFHIIVDEMKIDINRFLEEHQDTENKNKKIMELAKDMSSDVEGAHNYMLNNMQSIIDGITLLIGSVDKDNGDYLVDDFENCIDQLINTRNSIHKEYSRTISKISILKNKMVDSLIIDSEDIDNDAVKITMSGRISENSDLDIFQNTKKNKVILNLANLRKIDDGGVKKWNSCFKNIPDRTIIFIDSCPTIFLQVLQDHPDIVIKGSVRSFNIPFLCSKCGNNNTIQFDFDSVINQKVPSPICCESPMNIDPWSDDYYSIMEKLKA